MNLTEYLSREERIQKIGELLSKGVTLMLLREAESQRTQTVNPPPHEQPTPPAGESSSNSSI